jgi:hypothetical protein
MSEGDPISGSSARLTERVSWGYRATSGDGAPAGWIIETIVSPFHCLYQDALEFHQLSHLRMTRSEGEASRLSRAAMALYLSAIEALVYQAAAELPRAELAGLVVDPHRPLPLGEIWRVLPSLLAGGPIGSVLDFEAPPWPQFEELLGLRELWLHPGNAARRRAYYRSPYKDGNYEPLQPHQVPPVVPVGAEQLVFPRTGLPRDPYALRPRHLDTTRGIIDAAIEALDRRMGGALTQDGRHRKEPVRLVYPVSPG